jgi:glycosyltransferase involved in cell wall biosynthesis
VTPTFSVLIPAYNAEATVGQALDSLLAQSRADWEAIVVDDGSTDSTASIVAGYAARDPRIRVRTKGNGGSGSARNLAAGFASGSLFTLLDADDCYLPEAFARIGAFIEAHPDHDIFSSDGYTFRTGEARRPDTLHSDSEVRSFSAEDLIPGNKFRVLTTFRREVFDLAGGFDAQHREVAEDWDFRLRGLLRGAKHVHCPERLWEYRYSDSQRTSDLLGCRREDLAMLDRLLGSGELTPAQMPLGRHSRDAIARDVHYLEARQARHDLKAILASGASVGARAAYLRAAPAYKNRAMYLAGMVPMLISPRLFARLSRRR